MLGISGAQFVLIIISMWERTTIDLVCFVHLESYVVWVFFFPLPKQHKKTEISKEGRDF